MNFGEITIRVQRLLKDRAILATEIKAAINKQLRAVTAAASIPELIKKDAVTVTAGSLSAAMPTDYQHDMFAAYSTTNKAHLTIRTNYKSLYADYDWQSSGTIIDEVAVEGLEASAILYVAPKTSAEDVIDVTYYRMPDLLALDTDVPELPAEGDIHELCIVSGVVLEKLPETDMDPQLIKELMGFYGGRLQNGMQTLKAMYPHAPKARPILRRKTRFF